MTIDRRPRSCFTDKGVPKLRFNTRAEAKEHIRRLKKRYPNNKDVEPYRCLVCGYFHNGVYPLEPEARDGMRRRHREPLPPGSKDGPIDSDGSSNASTANG